LRAGASEQLLEATHMRYKILHHGLCTGEYEPFYVGADYFAFFHKPCKALAYPEKVLVDNEGRIIFNLKCIECGKRDALKTHPYLFRLHERPKEMPLQKIFHLSPKLAKSVKKHWWDDL